MKMTLPKPVLMICATHMFLEIYLLLQVALIPVYVREFQLNLVEASLAVTAPSLVQLAMNIPFGFLTDRFKAKHLLFASMVIEGLAAIFVSQANSFWTLVLGVSVMRISSPLYHISGLSEISRLAGREQISRSISLHNALGSLGSAMGSIGLYIFLSTIGWRWAYLFWAIPILIWGAVILMFSKIETKKLEKVEDGKTSIFPSKLRLIFSATFIVFLVALSLREVGIASTSTFMTTYFVKTRDLSEATSSLIFGLGPFIGIAGSIGGGYLCDKLGAKKALSLALTGTSISLSILMFASQFYLLAMIYIIQAFFNNSVWSPIHVIVADLTPEKQRGLSYSAYFLAEGLIDSIAPMVAAGVIQLSEVWYIFPFSIAFMIAALIVLSFVNLSKTHPT